MKNLPVLLLLSGALSLNLKSEQVPCDPRKLGDGFCDVNCNNQIWEYDRGDCCTRKQYNNKVCDPQCNFASLGYDGGDCCPKEK